MESAEQSERRRHFASDNYAGIAPEAWATLAEANVGHEVAYGDDRWTHEASDLIRQVFETDCEVFFVFNGTAANSLALSHLCQSYNSILCHETAHVETDECGAPEFFSNGTKILLLGGAEGRIDPASIERAVRKRSDIHFPKPRVLTLTNATELGTVYSPEQTRAVAEAARAMGLRVHLDGARFANAVASTGAPPSELTWKAGVDVLSFGGTKCGTGVGEAVVFFNRELAQDFDYRCKQAGHLASKMRFLSAPWVGMLRGGDSAAWLKHARHANAMAARLASLISPVTGAQLLFPRQANSVFVQLHPEAVRTLHGKGWRFYTFIGQGGCRLMCSWDTTEADVDALASDLIAAAVTAQSALPPEADHAKRGRRAL